MVGEETAAARSRRQSAALEIAARVLLAVVGGYAICYAVTGALAVVLPLDAHERVTTAGLLTPLTALIGPIIAFSMTRLRDAGLVAGGIAVFAWIIVLLGTG